MRLLSVAIWVAIWPDGAAFDSKPFVIKHWPERNHPAFRQREKLRILFLEVCIS